MEFKILAATQFYDDLVIKHNLKEGFTRLGGHAAGVCYMKEDIDSIIEEPVKKTLSRVKRTLESKHHSVYDHASVTLYLSGISKAFAMLLNNERMMTTSEKSARYTQMKLSGRQKHLYSKWKDIVRERIEDTYGDTVKFLLDKKDKLAQENARNFSGTFMPNTSMAYTCTLRQLNYQYSWMQNLMDSENPSLFYKLMFPTMKEFCAKLEQFDLIEPLLVDGKGWGFSLIDDKKIPEVFTPGFYSTNYLGTISQLAQAHRHRTLKYSMSIPEEFSGYIPPIIASDSELSAQWAEDLYSVRGKFPQGMNVLISERGTPEDFIKKMDERLCSSTQLEISNQTRQTAQKYAEALKPVDSEQAAIMQRYVDGARCTASSYKCNAPCGWADGIKGLRMI